MKNELDDELINMKQVAYMCNRSLSTVKFWVRSGIIPYDQISPNCEVCILKSDARRMRELCLGRKRFPKWSR